MKKIVAYINTNRVHWVVEELGPMGIRDIVVTEYFRPTSQISRFELLVQDDDAENVRKMLRRVGSNGSPGDHFIELYDDEGGTLDPKYSGEWVNHERRLIRDDL